MTKSTAVILKGVAISALFLNFIAQTDAQFISMNEPTRRELKSSENAFKVSLSEEEKNPLNFKVKIINPTQEPVKAYLRDRHGFNFLDEKLLSNDSKITMTLELAALEDGEYTFVIRTKNGFFIKHFNLQSGDLMTTKINGKDVMTTNRVVILGDE
ncbi:MAG: hypothetical protein V4585_17465 [Bacteroidota bacterium]|jgi:hypothetical protein